MKDRLSRRDLFALAATSGAALAFPRWIYAAEGGSAKKKLLILGGTRFLGPALVDAAMAKGWSLTLFNRGKTNPGLFKDRPLEEIHGDRNVADDLKKMAGRKWDAVIDTSAYFPRQVRSAMEVLSGNVGQYVLISSISVYATPMKAGMDETSAIARLAAGTDVDAINDIGEGNYGALKLLCEEAAEKAMPGKTLNIRPGYIVGTRDSSDRFTYWPVRVRRGGEVLVPGKPSDPLQFIDVRDLGDWTIRMVDSGTNGVFNATGPKEKLTMGPFLEACRKAAGSTATFTWAPEAKLKELGLTPDADFPIWVSTEGAEAGIGDVSIARALKAGITFRPLPETILSTLAWWDSLPEERRAKMKAGLSPEKEAAALAGLKAKAPGAAAPPPKA
ncbi:MAG TPA: NAD-dependent epimerase/dehydratase family protein [Thermoanaerobaculia bacterium]|nr:NAD-dependent epimerase/dehydratase family protein [Thermoanaerobaculia bacterium]